MQQLKAFKQIPDFCNYLSYIFAYLPQEAPSTRSIAGLALKNAVRENVNDLSPEVSAFVEGAALHGLTDAQEMIRTTSGTVIATLIANREVSTSTGILARIMELTSHPDIKIAEVNRLLTITLIRIAKERSSMTILKNSFLCSPLFSLLTDETIFFPLKNFFNLN